jgi:phage shock protein PspC (stress-responsive transcriptional regulator)
VLGLCAGIGEHLGVDPLLVRIALLLAMFVATGGLAVPLVYLLFCLFVPLADQ